MRKRRRRIALVLSVLCVGALTLGGLYVWQNQRHASHIDSLKPHGLEHLEAGEYRQAMQRLSAYLNRHPSDLEALRALAEARRSVYDPGGAHVRDTIGILRRILEHDRHDEAAQRELLELYVTAGRNTEAVTIAEQLLDRYPEDVEVLAAKARALGQRRDYDRAIAIADRHNELEAEDIELHTLVLHWMQAKGEPNREIVERAQALADAHPEDGRYLMVLGTAYQIIGERDAARQMYERAAEQMPDDAEEIGRLARRMDEVGLASEATALLRRAERAIDDPELLGLLFRRLWELGRVGDLLERAESLEINDPRADTEALGTLALAYLRTGEREKVQRIIDRLERRRDSLAQGWAGILDELAAEPVDPERLTNVAATALLRQPHHPYFHYFHGQGLAQQGQMEAAIEAWSTAARRAPIWAAPLVQAARAFISTDRGSLAIEMARSAMQRDPNNIDGIVTFLEAAAMNLGQFDDEQVLQYAQMVESVVSEVPATQRRLLPMLVELDARRGEHAAAAERINEALAFEEPLSPRILLQLAAVSDRHGLDLADECLALAEQASGTTTQLAYMRATREAREHEPATVIERFDRAAAAADRSSTGEQRAWALARAELLWGLGQREQAVSQWRELLERFEDEQRLLEAAVRADAVWSDTALARRAVTQLGEVAGERNINWRVGRARLILTDEQVSERALAEASLLLLEVTRDAPYLREPRMLLAWCFERMGQNERALDMYEQAHQLAPNSVTIALQRARLLLAQGDRSQAEALAAAVRRRGSLSRDHQRQLIALLMRMGHVTSAEQLLVELLESVPEDGAARLMLAQLYANQHRHDEAEALYRQILEQPNATALAAAIRFYEMRGELDQARALLDRLDEVAMSDHDRVRVRVDFHRRHNEMEQASALLAAGVARDDAPPALWTQLIAVQLARGEISEAFDSLDRAAAAHPEHVGFRTLAQHRSHIQAVADQPALRNLGLYILASDDYRDVAVDALRLIVDADQQQRSSTDVVLDLYRIAERAPRLLAVQQLLVQLYQSMGRHDDAANIALRAMRAMPDSADAAQLAAGALTAAERWSEAIEVAQELRERSPDHAQHAALLEAESQLRLGRGGAVVDRLNPLLEAAGTDEQAHALYSAQARALIQDGRIEQAREMFQPALSESPRYRALFMNLAVRHLPDADSAADWLSDVAALISHETPDEPLALARSWRVLDERFATDAHTPKAMELLVQLTARDDAPAAAFQLMGMIHEADGRRAEAETAYWQAVERDERMTVSKNNLAVILRERGEHTEALRLAEAAVELEPQRAAFNNTLAMTLLANDRPDDAVAAAQRAVSAEPQRIEWYLTFGQALVEAGQHDRARELVQWLDERLAEHEGLDPDLQQRFEALRDRVGAAGAWRDAPPETTGALALP